MTKHTPQPAVSATMLLYLGELYRLGGAKSFASPSALAEELQVTPPAVARMMGRMERLGLVSRAPYKGVRLTSQGINLALQEIRYHRLSEAFLVNVMGYGWHEAHDLADKLAEIADSTFVNRMEEKAGFPTRCPHGEPIPTREGVMPEVHDLPMTELQVGEHGAISRVKTRNPDKLVYFADNGLLPGAAFQVAGRAPFDGPIRIKLNRHECVLGRELAATIRVERR
jgi:DtxR family transcriptional regulator, Mn-dependent transcriptional regulator